MNPKIIVFAKAPIAGEAKTRLIPLIGAEGAAKLQRLLIAHSLRVALDARLGPVELCCTPDCEHPYFAQCASRFGVQLTQQGAGDLGARMHNALARIGNGGAILVGCDCPSLEADDLRQAAAALKDAYRAVFVPAEDGGYMLVGTTASDCRLFERIEWGGGMVMADTRERLRRLGWRWRELPVRWDVDRPADYERMLREGLLNMDADA